MTRAWNDKKWSLALFIYLPLIVVTKPSFAEPIEYASNYENSPFASARAAALSGALSTTANGLDAFYYNPALIGGYQEKADRPWITHLYVPYLGASFAPDSKDMFMDRATGEELDGDTMRDHALAIFDQKNRYMRASATPMLLIGRLAVGYTYNSRLAAYRDEADPLMTKAHISERVVSGPLLGFSATAPKEDFYLGVSAAILSVSEVEASLSRAEWESPEQRKTLLKAAKETYQGIPMNIGAAYRFKHAIKPAITAVVQDIGATRYSPSDKSKDLREQKETTTLGFSLSPELSTLGRLHVVTEATDLTDAKVEFGDKLRLSTEVTLGERFGGDAGLSVRLGYSTNGLSYGMGMNLGIIHAEFASYAEDIGKEKTKVLERRLVLNFGINIADY